MRKYIILLLFPNLVFAQNELSLMDAIELAMWQNYEIQISAKKQKINEINGSNWFLLRGNIDEIIKMAQLGYFAIASIDNHVENSLIHTENIVLVDDQQRIRGVYNGTSELEMSYLIDDIKRLLN